LDENETPVAVEIDSLERFSPDSPNPDSQNLEKVLSMSRCSCFVEKNRIPYLQLHF